MKSFKIATFLILLSSSLFISDTYAQDISLGISPPLTEIMIQPGKDFSQIYQLTNEGPQTIIIPKIVPFTTNDDFGNVKLLEKYNHNLDDYPSWFKIVDPKLNSNNAFLLPPGAKKNVTMEIAVPENAPEGDYYLTLLFETDNSGLIGGDISSVNAKIGTNILLTVSKDGNPTQKAKVSEFSAPLISDSFKPINYKVVIANTGSAFFKPVGKIIIKPFLGKEKVIEIAPQNILASSERQIPCVKDEALITCTFREKFLLGTYIAELSFQADGEGETYSKSATTVTFPYLLLVAIFISLSILFTIKMKQNKKG